ncbi:SDR family NAD(P)-dependent oxidoreductase [Nocardia acidivorans]|uniref:SDR family NAD(P)-dependent oxidoreductase n=1 Tax=Nocardia acidivorans TaxID=404580 RepID=UPI000A01B4E2|nr:SDR family NAD(P)-dependent oxidoreductase [Nocardia acidivorans]
MDTVHRPSNGLAAGPIGRAAARLIGPRGIADPARLRREVDGKIAVITGASHGVGAESARLLGAAGATVVLGARSMDELEAIATEIKAAGGTAVAIRLDLADPASITDFADEILHRFGRVDYLVHNAGKSLRRSIHLSYDRPKDLTATAGANYLGPMRLTLALLPSMRARRSGHIVNVSTVGVLFPVAPKWGFYLSSKAGFDVWMRAVGMEARPDGVTLTTIYAGLMHTRMSAPSRWMSALPGQTPAEAATVIARALIAKPRFMIPAYGYLTSAVVPLARVPLEIAFTSVYRRLGDTDAALRAVNGTGSCDAE